MRPSCRIFLSLLAIIGSLDIGFSFAHARKLPTSPVHSNDLGASSTVMRGEAPVNTMSSTAAARRRTPICLSPRTTTMTRMTSVNGGGKSAAIPSYKKTSVLLTSLWGSGGVIYILAKAIKRVVPIALEPFTEGAVPLSQIQLGIYVATCLWFAYVEGYKGFQTKFSPLVVQRSLTLQPGESKIHHLLFAPLYSMGLFHATKKRKIISWSVTIGVAVIVAAVKRLPYPWRNIIDAGVVAGLSWGSLSIMLIYLKAWLMGQRPEIDPALP